MATVAIGNNTFNNDLPAFTLEDEPYLRKLGVMGVLSGAIFRTSVLTIDMQRKKTHNYAALSSFLHEIKLPGEL